MEPPIKQPPIRGPSTAIRRQPWALKVAQMVPVQPESAVAFVSFSALRLF